MVGIIAPATDLGKPVRPGSSGAKLESPELTPAPGRSTMLPLPDVTAKSWPRRRQASQYPPVRGSGWESRTRRARMSDTSPVEIFSIGTELLIGRIQDTNSYWLSQQVTELGATVGRITIIGDDRATIVGALGEALARGARTIITSGGLGPTPDDLTVGCLAELLGVATEVHR